ncbi:sialate O-acetylesterase [Phaeobacter marinintestinus]|uniref:sialate O-acetylesterase n=1 Tax=Falsiphaeobacter marinintestinus TaxID=1492905 RepID=UPI0016452006|nr:sialate O-acetylesterase [Phaeobacter marinintestinus]
MFNGWFARRLRSAGKLGAAALIAVASVPAAATAGSNDVLIFIFGGQSNMVGTTIARKVPDSAAAKKKIYYSDTKGGNRFPDGQDSKNAMNFGPEYGFIKSLEANGINNFIIQKTSHGGTSIYPRTEPGRLDWYPDTRGELFDQMVRDYQALTKRIKAQGKTPVLKGIFWAQGAADARNVDNYHKNLPYFFDRMQQSLGQSTDIYLAQTNWPERERLKRFEPQMQIVRDTQQNYADTHSNVFIFSTKGYTKVDQVHFDPKSSFDMGTRFAALYFKRNGITGYTLPKPSSALVNAKQSDEFYRKKMERSENRTGAKRKKPNNN